jgi:hypothetical protein
VELWEAERERRGRVRGELVAESGLVEGKATNIRLSGATA